MRRIEDPNDGLHRRVTYELDDGRRVRIAADVIERHGLKAVMKQLGVEMPKGRVLVFQCQREVGSVPADFDPMFIRSNSFLYEPRPGDFKRDGEGWAASWTLGPGDLEAVPGFRWKL